MEFKELEEASEDRFFITEETPAQVFESKDTSLYIREHIRKLPAHYRNILYLYHIEEMTYPEIVEITGLPLGTVKNYLFRARKLLKEQLSKFITKEELL
jgi:RNA polymerase sigma-70 factor (ECF subfamily)